MIEMPNDFNWDKKISLKEIARFYEDRIRELDGQLQRLKEGNDILERKLSKNNSRVAELEKAADDLRSFLTDDGVSISAKLFEQTVERVADRVDEEWRKEISEAMRLNLDALEKKLYDNLEKELKEDYSKSAEDLKRSSMVLKEEFQTTRILKRTTYAQNLKENFILAILLHFVSKENPDLFNQIENSYERWMRESSSPTSSFLDPKSIEETKVMASDSIREAIKDVLQNNTMWGEIE
jgi:hypothetical protein